MAKLTKGEIERDLIVSLFVEALEQSDLPEAEVMAKVNAFLALDVEARRRLVVCGLVSLVGEI
ncbi:hypothetical protein ACT2CV_01280 [Pasteurellaceae bacterium 22721_9_1]